MNRASTLALVAFGLLANGLGCELITTIDRSKIDGTGGAGGAPTTTSSTVSSSSTGGAGGTGGSTGNTGGSTGNTGGTGGMPPTCGNGVMACAAATECPDPGTECIVRTCDAGCCGTTSVADLTATTAGQTGKNCKQVVCDGAGTTKEVDDGADVPDAMDECHTGVCTAGVPGQDLKAAGAACTTGGKVCDGAGTCVGCLVDGDCTTAGTVCDPSGSHQCVPPGCTDNAKNGTETDKDCGGLVCSPCSTGKLCLLASDCVEASCTTGVCAAATCTDGKQDGAPGAQETGVDCGGPCVAGGKTCAVGLGCAVNADCGTNYCDAATKKCATPTCSDGVQNGNETRMDCGGGAFQGGPACPKCGTGLGCTTGSDCASGFCQAGVCTLKVTGATCGATSECASSFCVDGVCCGGACTTGCSACSAVKKGAGADGVCGPIVAGSDPDNECTDQGAASCGNSGACDGAAACANYAAGTLCRTAVAGGCDVPETCAGNGAACPADVFTPVGTSCGTASCMTSSIATSACNGSGTCAAGAPMACANNLACSSATACSTNCGANSAAGDANCATGFWCGGPGGGGLCFAQQAAGGSCSRNSQCTTTCDTANGVCL